MQDIKNSHSFPRMSIQRLLRASEYTSITASAVGVIASVVSKQIAYAVTPFSLSIFLNLINRQQYERQIEQSIISALNQIDQNTLNIEQKIESQRVQITQLQNSKILSTSDEQKENQEDPNQILIQSEHLLSEIGEIRGDFSKLASTEQINNLRSEFQKTQIEQKKILDLLEQSKITTVKQNLEQLVASIWNNLENQIFNSSKTSKSTLTQLQDLDCKFEERLTRLQSSIDSIESLSLLDRLQNLDFLKAPYTNLQTSITSIEAQLGEIIARQASIEQGESILGLNAKVEKLQTAIDQLKTEKYQIIQDNQPIITELEQEINLMIQYLGIISSEFRKVEAIQAIGSANRAFTNLHSQYFRFLDVIKPVVDKWSEHRPPEVNLEDASVPLNLPSRDVNLIEPIDEQWSETPGTIGRALLDR